MDHLSRRLPNWSERHDRPLRREPGLFGEFAVCGAQEVFVRLDLALGDGPGMDVLVGPEWTTRMNQEDFELSVTPAKRKQSCAGFRH
jgi:hypothetical protein